MPAVPFSELPGHARVWIFAAERPLEPAESAALLEIIDPFIIGWAAHGAPVVGSRELRHDQFLIVAADERATGVSGCSTDTLFHAVAAAEKRLGLSLRDGSLVFWRDESGAVRAAPRPAFRALAAAGEVDAGTTVFDHTIASVEELRAGRWETRMADSWHARAFPIGAAR
jgi:hypothetical protein